MHRPTIAVVAVFLLAAGAIAAALDQAGMAGPCLRIGAVVSILWLAQPQLIGVPRWIIVALAMALVVLLRFPKLALVALVAAPVLWLLRPRSMRTNPPR